MAINPSSIATNGKVITQFTSDSPGVWSTGVGSLYSDAEGLTPYAGASASSVYFKAQNKTSSGIISCGAASAGITIIGVFPAIPHFPHDLDVTKRGVVTVKSRSGKISGRVLGDGALKRDPKLVFNLRSLAEYTEVEQFVNDHFPDLHFYYKDGVVLGSYQFFKLDGNPPLKMTYQSNNRMSFEIPLWME